MGPCSADPTKPSSVLQALSRFAVRIPQNHHQHCKLSPDLQCGSRKTIIRTASRGRESSAKARESAGALQARAGSALQKPESLQEHCKPGPGVQYKSQKACRSTASRGRKYSTKAGKPAGALQALSRLALQIPQIHHQQCIHPSPIPREHPRRTTKGTTPGKSAGMNRLTTFFSIPLVPLT